MSDSIWEVEDRTGKSVTRYWPCSSTWTEEHRNPVCNMEKNVADADMASKNVPRGCCLDP